METLIPRIFQAPGYSFFLFGPRGTGKTTYLKQYFPDTLWLDMLEPDIFRWYSAYPERLREIVIANPQKKTVVIDEIQKVPELLDVVHSLGVFRSLRPSGPMDKPEEIEGAALEGLVFQHIIAWNAYQGDKNKIFYWRTTSGSEVDFIIYGEDIFWAIEVKNSSRLRPEDLKTLKTYKSDYPECTPYFLYRGKERIMKNDILCLPVEEFLLKLDPEKVNPFFI